MNPKILKIIYGIIIVILIGAVVYFAVGKKSVLLSSDTNLKNIALSLNDVQGFNFVAETNFQKGVGSPNASAGYLINFDNSVKVGGKGVSGYKDLSNSLYIFNSLEDVKKDFVKNVQGFQNVKIEKIGDESNAFSGGTAVVVWFRKNNVMSSISLIGGDTNEAVKFAKLVESRIK